MNLGKLWRVLKFLVKHQEELVAIAGAAATTSQEIKELIKEKDKEEALAKVGDTATLATGVVMDVATVIKATKDDVKK